MLFSDITTQLRTENKNLQNQLETSFKMLQQVQDFIRDQLPASVAAFVEECQEKTKASDIAFQDCCCVFEFGFVEVIHIQTLN